ncbi:glycoside hydrolase family 28 protein [Pelagicoccus albus]|uniref:Glycoside hydrolase family 28 protein n=1 Tax=Pelagicoccus albus TaxID=415222 RepID=A0A7X1B6D1_9BACT|nr:glycoside hydrolase family 28 protein [Pelagicoccus albus]MBC2606494.1 glycoside hydrolase family 28 protein [Pelagicoccus albus]
MIAPRYFRASRCGKFFNLLISTLVVALFALALQSCSDGHAASGLRFEEIEVEAPFEMPVITVPDFSECERYPITEYGAIQGDKNATVNAIATAIDKASSAGGGVVVVPAGEWLTGPVHFKSNVNLHLEEGAILLFSENPEDYLPAVKTTWEGMECYNYSPLVYAYECENIAITGGGKLQAKLDVWREWYKRPPAHMEALKLLYEMASTDVPVEDRVMTKDDANMRPQFIQFNRCENVLLEGVSIEDSPFWVIHPFLSKNVVIRGVKVRAHGHNNDGVDPEMSQNILIEDCTFDQGDDAIAVKSGRNQDAWRLDTPTRNVVVRNCFVKNGHQLLAIGSELSGGVENVLIENCSLDRSIAGVGHLLFIKTNERRGGWVKNIHLRNIESGDLRYGVLGIETDVLYQWRDLVPTYERRLTPISEVYLENVRAGSVEYVVKIQGQAELPVKKVRMANIEVENFRKEKAMNENVIDVSLSSRLLEVED